MKRAQLARWGILLGGISTLSVPAFGEQAFAYLFSQFGGPDLVKPSSEPPADPNQPQALIRHDINDFGNCGFFAKRGVRWSQDFADGSRLELRCEPLRGSILPGFHLWYLKNAGSRFEIARCVFDEGFNQGWYYTSTDPAAKGPVRVEWLNVDGGKNDGGGRRLDKTHVTGPEEPYLDVVMWSFDPQQSRLECVSDKYEYTAGVPKLSPARYVFDPYLGQAIPELRRSFVKIFE